MAPARIDAIGSLKATIGIEPHTDRAGGRRNDDRATGQGLPSPLVAAPEA